MGTHTWNFPYLGLTKPEWVRCAVALGAPSSLDGLDAHEVEDVFGDHDLASASPCQMVVDDAPPMLLVHGTADNVCSIEQARQHAQTRPGVELLEVKDGDHGIRWPPFASLRARRQAVTWMVEQMDMPQRGSKWKRRKKGKR